MIDKKHLLKELEEDFEKLKKELGFKSNLDELDLEFGIKDSVLNAGFVSEDLADQILSRIVEHFRESVSYLNNLLASNSNLLAAQTEVKLFNSEADKKFVWDLTKVGMKFSSMKAFISLNRDKKLQAEFIDSSLEVWRNILRPGIEGLLKRAYDAWNKE
jgi:hypothetical protein